MCLWPYLWLDYVCAYGLTYGLTMVVCLWPDLWLDYVCAYGLTMYVLMYFWPDYGCVLVA